MLSVIPSSYIPDMPPNNVRNRSISDRRRPLLPLLPRDFGRD
jgi:hypothetical protein